jgi:hypothetical protein
MLALDVLVLVAPRVLIAQSNSSVYLRAVPDWGPTVAGGDIFVSDLVVKIVEGEVLTNLVIYTAI